MGGTPDTAPDKIIADDFWAKEWSNVAALHDAPTIDFDRMHRYRTDRLKQALADSGAAMVMLHNPISLRYAVDYRCYSLYQTHIPSAYLFLSQKGESVFHTTFGQAGPPLADRSEQGRPIAFFDGAELLPQQAELLADDVCRYLSDIGSDNRRVALEYVNPSVTLALNRRGLDVIDGVNIAELARLIKCEDEINCIRWAIAVAEHGITKMREVMREGVSELQLWGLLNYVNLANNGDWHEGRMLASGDRINPWYQEASERKLCAGDLLGFDTDMIGPFGYFADISRTFFCGGGGVKPSVEQRRLYRLAVDEVQHNLGLLRAGVRFSDMRERAYAVPEAFQQNAYTCILHGVGMGDEYPRINPSFREGVNYDGVLQAGMVVCIESYMGEVGARDGVKIEQQVLVTEDGYELLTHYPLEEELLG